MVDGRQTALPTSNPARSCTYTILWPSTSECLAREFFFVPWSPHQGCHTQALCERLRECHEHYSFPSFYALFSSEPFAQQCHLEDYPTRVTHHHNPDLQTSCE